MLQAPTTLWRGMNSYRHTGSMLTLQHFPTLVLSAFSVLSNQEPLSSQSAGQPRLAQMEVQDSCSSCISHFWSPFLFLLDSMQEPLKIQIPTQPGKRPFTGTLPLVSTGSKAQEVTSPEYAANNFCREMVFAQMVPMISLLFPLNSISAHSQSHRWHCLFHFLSFLYFILFIL